MRIRKVIGITMLMMSLLLQVTYAAVFNYDSGKVVGAEAYNASFERVEIATDNDYIEVANTAANDSATELAFSVKNLYPGSNFELKPSLKNYGSKALEIESVEVKGIDTDITSDPLLALLRGYDKNNHPLNLEDYNTYLKNNIEGTVLNVNETQTFNISLGLAPEVTNMQNLNTEFKLIVNFRQPEEDEPNPSNSPDSSPSPSTKPTRIEVKVIETPTPTITPEPTPTIIPKPTITPMPTASPTPEREIKETQTTVVRERETGKLQFLSLPKTGGIGAAIVISIGIILAICGAVMCKKKDDE